MSIDDTPDKLRRNLVVFSSIYLAAIFLEVDIREVAPITEKLKNVNTHRMQILILFVFVYLACRWFTSKTQKSEWGHFYDAWGESVASGLERRFQKFIDSGELKSEYGIEISGQAKRELSLDSQAAEELHYWHTDLVSRNPSPEDEKLFILSVKPQGRMSSGVVNLSVVLIYYDDSGKSTDTLINYQLGFIQICSYHLKAASVIMGHAAFWEWFIPILLAVPTCVVIAYKLVF